ncbi:agmatine deiminase family protein [candidate division KSB1 bacterium]|nr:agmatine deiminase family protein [candidate division KSB1 bacterium]
MKKHSIRAIWLGAVFHLMTASLCAQMVDDSGIQLLPRGLAPGERAVAPRTLDYLTTPPAEPVRAVAEWEEVEALMVRWPNSTSWNALWAQFIAPVALDLKIYVICATAGQAISAENYFIAQGVPVDSMEFPVQATNSVWIRDYGPWWAWRENSWDRAIVDWIYNRPRPQDDSIPEWEAREWGHPYYGPNLVFTGGNFMVDGWGRGFCSELVFDENVPTVDTRPELDSVMSAFMNLDTMYTFPRFFGIDHIDMSMKLLNDHTTILNQYPAGNSFNAVMDSCAEILAGITNPWGEAVAVHRVPTPSWSGGVPFTYTNAIFVNNKVLLPIYSRAEDTAALALWDSLLPGYSIHGFDCNTIIPSQGAIHCVVKEVIHRHLIRIEYAPLPAALTTPAQGLIDARVVSLGTLDRDSLQLFFATDAAGPWQTVGFDSSGIEHYAATLPPQLAGGPVYYYVRAKNVEGNWTTMPRYGPDAHYLTRFAAGEPAGPQHLVANRSGDDLTLSWDAVTQDVNGIPIAGVEYDVYGSLTLGSIVQAGNLLTTTSSPTALLVGEAIGASTLRYFQVVARLP